VQQGVSKGKRLPSLFSTTDEAYHANLRRSVNNAFAMSQLVQYEPGVTECVEVFLDHTEKLYAKTGKVCDFAEWLQFFAFDVSGPVETVEQDLLTAAQVIGYITYSKRHGFIEGNKDVDGMIGYLGHLFSYVAPVSVPLFQCQRLLTRSTPDRTNTMVRSAFPEESTGSSAGSSRGQAVRVPSGHFCSTTDGGKIG
jgi:hypothetical protein